MENKEKSLYEKVLSGEVKPSFKVHNYKTKEGQEKLAKVIEQQKEILSYKYLPFSLKDFFVYNNFPERMRYIKLKK